MKEINGHVVSTSKLGDDDFIVEIYSTTHSNILTVLGKSNLKLKKGDKIKILVTPGHETSS